MLNNITLIGYLANEPDLRMTVAGSPICRFTVATTRPMTANKERQVDFLEIVTTDKKAEFVNKWFKKGDPISLTGQLQTQIVVQEGGQTKKVYEIFANTVDFVPKRKEPTPSGDAPF